MHRHFQTFAAPDSQGWLTVLRRATTHVGPRAAGPLCYDLIALVQLLRAARRSMFRFNPEGCACCRVWLTPEERLLMEMLGHLRHGRTGRGRTVAQLLCDGTPVDDLIAMAETCLHRHAPIRHPHPHPPGRSGAAGSVNPVGSMAAIRTSPPAAGCAARSRADRP